MEHLIVWLISGAIVGWLAGLLVTGGGFGILIDIVVGIVGSFIGSWLNSTLHIGVGAGFVGSVIVSICGAVILLIVLRAVGKVFA